MSAALLKTCWLCDEPGAGDEPGDFVFGNGMRLHRRCLIVCANLVVGWRKTPKGGR